MERVQGMGGFFFRARDLAAMAAQLRQAGIAVDVDAEEHPNGVFATIHDPEGNPIQLWEPRGRAETRT